MVLNPEINAPMHRMCVFFVLAVHRFCCGVDAVIRSPSWPDKEAMPAGAETGIALCGESFRPQSKESAGYCSLSLNESIHACRRASVWSGSFISSRAAPTNLPSTTDLELSKLYPSVETSPMKLHPLP